MQLRRLLWPLLPRASRASSTSSLPSPLTLPVENIDEAVMGVHSGENVFFHTAAAAPALLIEALARRAGQLRDVNTWHIHYMGPAPHLAFPESFRDQSFFVGANVRKAVTSGAADYIPIFLSQISQLFCPKYLQLDTALISVSPPDRHGFVSLGPSVDISLDAILSARKVVAFENDQMPRTYGDSVVHVSKIHTLVKGGSVPLPIAELEDSDETMNQIGKHVAELIEDGATLQLGIGKIPDAILSQLKHHKDLGLHTEMFADGVMELVDRGVINNSKKVLHAGRSVGSFFFGSKRLYDFMDHNPAFMLLKSCWVNDPSNIKQNPKMIAINSCLEIDTTGQVCADSIGHSIYSGIGGQMDFERGAALSPGGKPVIALPSRTSKGKSRIVSELAPGAGVVTTRGHVHWVVTEYGKVNLFGKSIRERIHLLTSIAHPEDRPRLLRDAKKNHLI